MIDEMSGDFFQQLRGFYYVAQLGSMGQAAKILHRSQSSVSRLIKQLEQSLGITLFSRVQKGVILTEEGKELFRQAIEIFDKIRSLHSELDCLSSEPSGNVSVMSSQIALLHFVAPLLEGMHKSMPKIRLNIYETGSSALLVKQLEEHSLDFALAVSETPHSHLAFYPLFDTNILLVTPKGYDLGQPGLSGQEGEVDLGKLAERTFVTMPEVFGLSRFIEQHLLQRNIHLEETCQVPNMLLQLHMVAAGMGLAIVHEAALHTFARDLPLAAYPLGHIFPAQQYGAVYLKDAYMTPQARAVLELFMRSSKSKNVPPVCLPGPNKC